MPAIQQNTLFYGDNLPILREHIPDASVDLIYLDPPFNSNRSYNILFKEESGKSSEAQVAAFDDSWHWGQSAEDTYHELVTQGAPEVAQMVAALRGFIGANQMMAYLVMMAARLVELHRVLKPTGSLYLHCDPTASHYLKIILDIVFGADNFRNEIVWKRTGAHNSANRYGPIHDILLYYSKSNRYSWNQQYKSQSEYVEKRYSYIDDEGRRFYPVSLMAAGIRQGSSGLPWRGIDVTANGNHWRYTIDKLEELDAKSNIYWPPKGGKPRLKMYFVDAKGSMIQDWWDDIPPINSQAAERLGYPTQKPLALLERIVAASSNPGDVVLDPFCGCGTAIAAAHKLGRRWIGIDITHLAITLQKYRLETAFGLLAGKDYQVIGEPEDISSARQLAQDDRYQFQWWALSLVGARPIGGETGSKQGKKGSDKGIDGVINFIDDAKGKPSSIIIQVKSGHVKSGDIRDLRGAVEREEAAIGVFITLEPATKDMEKEAVVSGVYHSKIWQQDFPRLQIITIEQLLAGAQIKMPPRSASTTFKKAEKVKKVEGKQGEFGM